VDLRIWSVRARDRARRKYWSLTATKTLDDEHRKQAEVKRSRDEEDHVPAGPAELSKIVVYGIPITPPRRVMPHHEPPWTHH
jgi:hypothetical protein